MLVRLGTTEGLGQLFSMVLSCCQIDFVWLFLASECAILCATNKNTSISLVNTRLSSKVDKLIMLGSVVQIHLSPPKIIK